MKNKIVKEWFERAKRNFEVAKLVFTHGEYYDEGVFLLHQAVEKYLKGYLIFRGWELKKIHDIYLLLSEATQEVFKYWQKTYCFLL
jgi:HEPN domain-containing protein